MAQTEQTYEVSNKILTIPNMLSFIRLCMIPVFLYLLLHGYNLAATILFAVAASTDWIDGQVARRTNSVSKLGQLLDPAVDRLLLISGVVGLLLVGRIPIWIIVFVIARDLCLLIGGAYILKKWHVRVDVIYLGKFATTCLYIGFAGILLNMPLLAGFGICDVTWLPLFNHDLYSWGFWFVYFGLFLSIFSTTYYIKTALSRVKQAKVSLKKEGE